MHRFFPTPKSRKAVPDACFLVSECGQAILEFAIALPVLVVFVVGIFDFSGALNVKQKIEQAAHEGAVLAAAQPMGDIQPADTNPDSLQPVVAAIFNSLAGSQVLVNANSGTCRPPTAPSSQNVLKWNYSILGCSNNPTTTSLGCHGDNSDTVWIEINRGWRPPGNTQTVGTSLTVSYDYDWRFNSVIQLLLPGAGYAARTCITETAKVYNQT